MSAKDLALNLLIKAKDMASGVVRNFKEEVEDSGRAAEELDRSLDQAEEGIEELDAATGEASRRTGHFVNQLSDADKAAGRYYDSAGRMHDANGKFVKGAKRARTETDKLGDELDSAGRKADGLSGRVGVLIGRLKGLVAATAIGAGLKWFFEQSITSAARFERQMNRVEAVTNATAEEMAVLEQAAEEAGSTTEYSAVQAAEGLEILGRAGFNARQSVELLPSVLAVAAAEGVDLAEAAGMISDTLAVMQMEVGKGAKVTDILAKGSSLANTRMTDLGLAISYAGQYAKPANLDLEKLVAILDVLAQNSLRGERGGTGLRAILAQLSDPASKASKAIKQLNLPTDDFIGLIEGLKQKGPEATEAINAFGIEAGPALRALIASGAEGIGEFEQKLRDVDGAAKAMADTATDDLIGGVKGAQSAWDGLIKTYSKPLLKPLTQLVEQLAAKFREMNEDGNLKAWGDITVVALQAVSGSMKIVYNAFTLSAKAVGVFVTTLIVGVADAERAVAKLMNRVGLVSDETVRKLEMETQALREVLATFVREAEEDVKDIGEGWDSLSDLLSGKVTLGVEKVGEAADESGEKAKAAGEAAAEGAKTAEQATKEQAKAQQEAAEAAAKLAQAQKDAWDTLGHDIKEVTGALTDSGSAAVIAFETVATSGKASAEQIDLAFASALAQAKTKADVKALTDLIWKLGVDGKIAGEQVATGFLLAEKRVEQLSNTVSTALDRALQSLEVDIVKIKTGFSELGLDALDNFGAVQDQLIATGTKGKEAAQITRDAFESALSQISTTKGLDELKAKLFQAAKAGLIGWDDYRKGLEAIEAKYADLEKAAESSIFGQKSALKGLAGEARKAAGAMSDIASSTQSQTAATNENTKATTENAYRKWANARATEASADATQESAKAIGMLTQEMRAGGKTQAEWQAMGDRMGERFREIANQSQNILNSVQEGTLGYIAAMRKADDYLGRAGRGAIESWERQRRKIEAVEQALERGSRVSESMLAGLELIDQQRLDNVRSAIRSMNDEARRVGDTLRGTVASLRQQLADLQGDQLRSEQLAQEQRMLQLREQYEQAKGSGDREALRAAREAMSLQEQIHQERMQQIRQQKDADARRQEEQAQADAAQLSQSSAPSAVASESPANVRQPERVVRVELDIGSSRPFMLDTTASESDRLLRELDAARRISS